MKTKWFWLLTVTFFTAIVILGSSSILYAYKDDGGCGEVGDTSWCCAGEGDGEVCYICYKNGTDCYVCDKSGCTPMPVNVTPTPPGPPVIMQPGMQGDFRQIRPTAPATPEATTQPTQTQPTTPQMPTPGKPAGSEPGKPAVQPQPKAVQPGSPPPVVK